MIKYFKYIGNYGTKFGYMFASVNSHSSAYTVNQEILAVEKFGGWWPKWGIFTLAKFILAKELTYAYEARGQLS